MNPRSYCTTTEDTGTNGGHRSFNKKISVLCLMVFRVLRGVLRKRRAPLSAGPVPSSSGRGSAYAANGLRVIVAAASFPKSR
jgi:hypothetical protein